MDSFSKPLVRCRALYLGSAPIKSTVIGFDSLQKPLSDRFKPAKVVNGVESRLYIYDTGIQLQFTQEPSQIVWFPIGTLHVCAAIKCVSYIDGITGLSTNKFLPIDSITPELSSCSPPIYAFISRSNNMSVCHVFICRTDQASLMLVQCCTTAYDGRDASKDNLIGECGQIPEEGAFLANSKNFIQTFNISNPQMEEKKQTIRSLPPSQGDYSWDTRSVASLPRGLHVVYAPESIVQQGADRLKEYLQATQRHLDSDELSNYQNTPVEPPRHNEQNTSPRHNKNNKLQPLPAVGRDNRSPRQYISTINEEEPRSPSPLPDYETSPTRKRNSYSADCPVCNPAGPVTKTRVEDVSNCPICNPRGNGRITPNPLVTDSPFTPPPDYDITDNGAGALPKLGDVMRRRAESIMGDNDEVLLRENRGRRPDLLGGRLANTSQNRNERAFGQSIGEELRSNRNSSSMMGGPTPGMSAYELNGVIGDRIFEDLHDTLGYYP